MSAWVLANAAPSAARKQTAPTPVGLRPAAVSSVMAALGTMKSESRFAAAAGARPRRASQKPTGQPVGRPSSAWIRASCSSRCSSDGWVEVRVLSETPLMAGAMKNAFIALAARRSRDGIVAISPVIFCSAEASAPGFWVR